MMQTLDKSHGGPANPIGMVTRVHSKNRNGPVPDRLFAKFVYSQEYLDQTPGQYDVNAWRANSIYDPQQSVGSGQLSCKYFAEYSLLYRSYRVHAAHIEVLFVPMEPNTVDTLLWCYLIPTLPGTALPGTINQADAYPNAVKCRVTNEGNSAAGRTCKMFMKIGSLSGVTDIQDDENYAGDMSPATTYPPGLAGALGSDPVNQEYFVILVFSDTGTELHLSYTCKITYYTELFDTRPPYSYGGPALAEPPPRTVASLLKKSAPDEPPAFDEPDMTDSVLVEKVVAAIKSSKK